MQQDTGIMTAIIMEQQKPTGPAQDYRQPGSHRTEQARQAEPGAIKHNPGNKAYRQERITQVLTHSNNKDINLYQTKGENP
jgi:hypothetical protein